MLHRLALAALLIGSLAFSANAQKSVPRSADQLTWDTIAVDPSGKMVTKRASVPGGWLVLVQSGDSTSLTFFPDAGHRWANDSPSDLKAFKEKAKFEDITTLDKAKADLEQARAAAVAKRDKAIAALKKTEEDRKRRLDELDKAKKERKPKKDENGDKASDSGKETESLRIGEALGLAAREESQRANALAEQARAREAAARQEAEIKLLAKEMRGEPNKRLEVTTVDIVTDQLAISVAWAAHNAWEPVIGQSLHHALILEKRPAVVLLRMRDDEALVERCCDVCRAAGIQVILRDTTTHKSEDRYKPSAGELAAMRRPGKQGDELFELHILVRRTVRGADLLLAGTVPMANGAAAAAQHINQLREYGMIGLTILPLILKTDAETNRTLQSAVMSIKAEASGPRLVLTASIPDEATKAVSDLVHAVSQGAKRLIGQ